MSLALATQQLVTDLAKCTAKPALEPNSMKAKASGAKHSALDVGCSLDHLLHYMEGLFDEEAFALVAAMETALSSQSRGIPPCLFIIDHMRKDLEGVEAHVSEGDVAILKRLIETWQDEDAVEKKFGFLLAYKEHPAVSKWIPCVDEMEDTLKRFNHNWTATLFDQIKVFLPLEIAWEAEQLCI